jgi:opacity protein-like surface antigen
MRIRALLLLACSIALSPITTRAQNLADYDYTNLAFRGIGFDFGYVWPTRVESTSMYTVRLDLGYLGPAVRIVPSLSYWSSRFRESELGRLAERLSQLPPLRDQGVIITPLDLGNVDWTNLTLALDGHVVWTVPGNVLTFAGAGVALHALNGRGDVIADTFIEDLLDSTTAGIAVLAGAEIQPTPRLRFYGEARYTVASDVRYPALRIGAAWMMPTPGQAVGQQQGGR